MTTQRAELIVRAAKLAEEYRGPDWLRARMQQALQVAQDEPTDDPTGPAYAVRGMEPWTDRGRPLWLWRSINWALTPGGLDRADEWLTKAEGRSLDSFGGIGLYPPATL